MQQIGLEGIFILIPYALLILSLFLATIIGMFFNIKQAIEKKDYEYLRLVIALTILPIFLVYFLG